MSADRFVTACPACGTRFRVNAAQLQAAAGRVRCGACLDIFDARTHAVPLPGSDSLVDVVPPFDAAPIGTVHPRIAAGSDAAPAVLGTHGEAAVSVVLDDPVASDPTADHVASDPAAAGVSGAGSSTSSPRQPQMDGSTTDAPADDAPAVDQSATLKAAAIQPPSLPRFVVLDPQAADEVAGNDPARRRRAVLETPFELRAGLTSEERSQFDVLALDPEESFTPAPRRWRLLGIGVAGMLLVLGQTLYYKVDEWSSDPGIRPVYDGLCAVLGCDVPTYRDQAAMQGLNIIVRPHPERADLLLVDAQILNTAPYAQAFPDLRLDLLDRNGDVVSSRVFEPGDSRGGELATMPDVPSNRPLQVSLEVYRPRADVVNFRFELLPATPRS